jgi:hypothetical protein
MKSLICDVCKKPIQAPIKDRNYFHIEDKDICEPCKDALEASIKAQMRARHPFSYEWYEPLTMETIKRGMQKGKIL